MREKTIGKSDGVYDYFLSGMELVNHLFFDCIRAKHYWTSTIRYHDDQPNSRAMLRLSSLIDMIDGALALCPKAVTQIFLIYQTL